MKKTFLVSSTLLLSLMSMTTFAKDIDISKFGHGEDVHKGQEKVAVDYQTIDEPEYQKVNKATTDNKEVVAKKKAPAKKASPAKKETQKLALDNNNTMLIDLARGDSKPIIFNAPLHASLTIRFKGCDRISDVENARDHNRATEYDIHTSTTEYGHGGYHSIVITNTGLPVGETGNVTLSTYHHRSHVVSVRSVKSIAANQQLMKVTIIDHDATDERGNCK